MARGRQFAQLPDDLVIDRRLSSHAVRVWARLAKYAGKNGACRPARGTLADDLGLSEVTIKRALGELVETGWITRVQRGSSNVWENHLNTVSRVTGDPASNETRVTGDPGYETNPGHRRPGLKPTRVTGDPGYETNPGHRRPGLKPTRVTGDPGSGHGRPGVGSPVTRPRKETQRRRPTEGDQTTALVADAPDRGVPDELDLSVTINPPAATEPNAVQILVGAYVDAITDSGGIATTAQRKAIGSNVRRLIKDDAIPLPVLLVAVQRAGARRERNVDRFLGEAQAGYASSHTTRQAMFAAWDALPARLAATRSAS